MKEVDRSNLLMWKMYKDRFMFQTEDSAIHRKMKGRKSFIKSAVSPNRKFWTYYCDLPSMRDAKSRFKSICGRAARYCKDEEIYY